MNIAFRCDASTQIGTGHVMRCLTLANVLKAQGAACTFVCREHSGHLASKIKLAGHNLVLLPEPAGDIHATADLYAQWLGVPWQTDAEQTLQALEGQAFDWLTVDHYGLDAQWENRIRSVAKRIMVIDDLANRTHDCDVLLDQNLGRQAADYATWVSSATQLFIGPQYALLRPEFAQWREYSLERRQNPVLNNILVTLGGVDKDNVTSQVLDALAQAKLPSSCTVTVVMGGASPWLEKVQQKAKQQSYACEVLCGVNNMAELMANSDLAIGAAGSTSWERCCLGLPSFLICLADNQKEALVALSRIGAASVLDKTFVMRDITNLLTQADMKTTILAMSEAAAAVTSGVGANFVVSVIKER